MGVEDFRVRISTQLRDGSVARWMDVAREWVESTPLGHGVRVFTHDDGQHIVEAVLGPDTGELTVRFALCNLATVDAVFVRVVEKLASEFDGDVYFEVGAADEAPSFCAPGRIGLAAAIFAQVGTERALWMSEFGTRTFKASCAEAVSEFLSDSSKPG